MKKITTTHASIRYDVLKKNLLHNQEVLLTYSKLLKATSEGAATPEPTATPESSASSTPVESTAPSTPVEPTAPSTPVESSAVTVPDAVSPITDHIEAISMKTPGFMISHHLSQAAHEKRRAIAETTAGEGFVNPHGELYQHLDQYRDILTDAAKLNKGVEIEHLPELSDAIFHETINKNADKPIPVPDGRFMPLSTVLNFVPKYEKIHALANKALQETYGDGGPNFDNATTSQKALAILSAHDKMGAPESGVDDETKGQLQRLYGIVSPVLKTHYQRAQEHANAMYAAHKDPKRDEKIRVMLEEKERERKYAEAVSEELHKQMQRHLSQNKSPETFVGDFSALGEDPKIKHSERQWRDTHLELGRALWRKYREDVREQDPERGQLAATQFWADRGFHAGVRVQTPSGDFAPSYSYLQDALKARDENRLAYLRAYGGQKAVEDNNLDVLPKVNRFGVNSKIPQKQLEDDFVEKQAREFSNQAMKEHKANVAIFKEKKQKEKEIEDRIAKLKALEPRNRAIGGGSAWRTQLESAEKELREERSSIYSFARHNALGNITRLQEDFDSHFDPYFTDAFRHFHAIGRAHVEPYGKDMYAESLKAAANYARMKELQNSRAATATAAVGASETGRPVSPTSSEERRAAVARTGAAPGAAPGAVPPPMKKFEVYPFDVYAVESNSDIPGSIKLEEASKRGYEKLIDALFNDPEFSKLDTLRRVFDPSFLKKAIDSMTDKEKASGNLAEKIRVSLRKALDGPGAPSVVKMLSKMGVKTAADSDLDTSTYDEEYGAPKELIQRAMKNPDFVFKKVKDLSSFLASTDFGTPKDKLIALIKQSPGAPKIPLNSMFNASDYHVLLAEAYREGEADIKSKYKPDIATMEKMGSRQHHTIEALREYLVSELWDTTDENATRILNALSGVGTSA